MTLTRPSLTTALPGEPITAGAWNALADGIKNLYSALGDADQDYVDVIVSFRGGPVPGASVLGIPLAPVGPSLAAAPPADSDPRTHTLMGARQGKWRIVVRARGFREETRELPVKPAETGPAGSVTVELVPETVQAPDLVGLPVTAAESVVRWARLAQGGWEATTGSGTGGYAPDHAVVLQGPSPETDIVSGTAVNLLFAGSGTLGTPWRTIVPDFLGWPAPQLQPHANYFQLDIVERDTPAAGDRVTGQSLPPGQVVRPHTALEVHYGPGEKTTARFEPYAGTHPKLAGRLVQDVVDGLSDAVRTAPDWTPWPVARAYVGDEYLAAVLAGFAGFDAGVVDPAVDLEAIWRSLNVVLHWAMT